MSPYFFDNVKIVIDKLTYKGYLTRYENKDQISIILQKVWPCLEPKKNRR